VTKKRRTVIIVAIALVLVFVPLCAWKIFRYWEGTHGPAVPQHSLSWVRPRTDRTDKLIVFVHGFGSDAKSAWTNDRTGAYWPDLVARDSDLSNYAVLTTSYSSPVLQLGATIEQTAQGLETALKDAGVYTRFSQIVFISHSMGGLVVRRVLVLLDSTDGDGALTRVGPVFFFATPTSGARLADLADWISMNPQAHDLRTADVNTFLQALDTDWENVLRRRAERTAGHPQVYCSYELQRTQIKAGIWVQVVPELYAKTTCDETPDGFQRDHFSLVKPDDNQDDVYMWTKERILGINGGARKVSWTAGETLGQLVDRLQNAHRSGQVPEIVRLSPTAESAISGLWIPPVNPGYEGESWGELFKNVAVDHACLSVNLMEPAGIVELAQAAPVKTCHTRVVCKSDKCER
jgi:hypothetical protein